MIKEIAQFTDFREIWQKAAEFGFPPLVHHCRTMSLRSRIRI